MWRKNRRKNRGLSSLLLSLCDGVDLNRNFGYHWSDANPFAIQSSTQITCAETYSGPGPFSEPESANIRDFVTSIQQNVVVSRILFNFLTAILHRGLHIHYGLLFSFSIWTFISLFSLDFYSNRGHILDFFQKKISVESLLVCGEVATLSSMMIFK